MRGIFAGAVLVIVSAVPTSAAAIDYISKFRSVDATASGSPVHKENSALGVWTETASITHITLAFPTVVLASDFVSQTSISKHRPSTMPLRQSSRIRHLSLCPPRIVRFLTCLTKRWG
jgi:hypothetical protein